MIVNYTVSDRNSLGLGSMEDPARLKCSGSINFANAMERRAFGRRCNEWLELGYTVETWKD